ncbi:MAG TPA: phospholipase D-like domain-containing protein [Croceibacterium sp.]|nr:phospholipase D-like domain-containing protein [Croceibacterium sp.]
MVDNRPADTCDDSSVEPGVWRYAMAHRVRVIVDAEDYFDLMQQAMLKARRRVLLIGWDFDTRIHLTHGRRWWQKAWKRQFPARLGSFIPWLTRHRDRLEIRILKWGAGALKFLARGTMVLDLLRWFPHKRIDFKFDTAHPLGCSHHQKIVVIDDRLAVCGGIDMTDGRWDTRAHRETDPRRRRPGGSAYGPWHDITMMMEGPIAGELDALGRDRWRRAGGKPLGPVAPTDASAWPEGLAAHFEDVEIGIARTRAAYGGDPGVGEVETLFVRQIARARRLIYAENQYFASRAVAEAISARLVEADPPEVVIVHPASADGWIESTVMDPARARLIEAIREIDRHNRFHIYTPYTGETPIYVHAKVLIVDDVILRIGSANFNNRSMGLDTECDVFIDGARQANAGCEAGIRALRHSLLAEHCGVDEAEVAQLIERAGSMAGMIAALGRTRGRHLRPFHPAEPTGLGAELADREVFDPEEPAEMFQILPPGRGLFRRGSLLARAKARLNRKRRPR